MIEFPVTLPRVVASAAAAKGTGPRRPTKATEVRLITRLHTMDKLTGSARPAWFLASPTKPPSSVAAFSRASGDMAPVPETALTSPASKSPSPSSSPVWTSSYPSLLRGAPIPQRIPQTRREECRRPPKAVGDVYDRKDAYLLTTNYEDMYECHSESVIISPNHFLAHREHSHKITI